MLKAKGLKSAFVTSRFPRWSVVGLMFMAHVSAFTAEPKAYLLACWWRLCGKRVRARAHFARLLALSPFGYALHTNLAVYTENPVTGPNWGMDVPPIVAFVLCTGQELLLQRTEASLIREGLSFFVVKPGVDDELSGEMPVFDAGWYMLLLAGDTIARGAADCYRAAVTRNPDAEVIYADDDLLDGRQHRYKPHFKPDWNSELFRYMDYISGACIVNASLNSIVVDEHAFTNAHTAAIIDKASMDPVHIREVLHHRHSRPEVYKVFQAAQPLIELPLVTIIIPTRDRRDLLETCITGLAQTSYPKIEVIVVDNGSSDWSTHQYFHELRQNGHKVLSCPGPFNYSRLNNYAVGHASGEMICLLNNDIEIIQSDWLKLMVHQALRDDVGAVGAQLLYPDGRIQHAGVVIGVGNAAGHAHRFVKREDEGYFRRHSLPHFVSAVTAACLVVRLEKFKDVGGLNERDFPVAFNDVDLCLRLNQRGWQSLYEARAVLVHHESLSRGFDHDPVGAARFAGELAMLQQLWSTDAVVDPFHHPKLNRACEQFVVQL